MANPKLLGWVNPLTYTDGTPYTQADNAGYKVKIDNLAPFLIPDIAWATSFDLSSIPAFTSLKRGSHTIAVAAVSKAGIDSVFSTPYSFQIEVAPNPPTNLGMA